MGLESFFSFPISHIVQISLVGVTSSPSLLQIFIISCADASFNIYLTHPTGCPTIQFNSGTVYQEIASESTG